jgi:pyridoxamine 5'-phosphate oxidase
MENLDALDLAPDPFRQFAGWFADARASGNLQPDAMALATATPDGRPSLRLVLLKGFDGRGFVFYTNYGSQKGRELEVNPLAAAAIYWPELHRQVRITGRVQRLSREESERYFRTRPRDAQISALASHQSRPIAGREELERQFEMAEARHAGNDVPLPEDWGGLRLSPDTFEFWQGQPSRLHDRFRYVRQTPETWRIERLQP